MRHDPGGFPPFGDDEDANRAVRAAMSLTGDLASAITKLERMTSRDPGQRAAQADHVGTLRRELHGRADAVFVDRVKFVEACEAELSRRLRRKITLTAAPKRQQIDDEARAFQMAIYDAEIFEGKKEELAAAAQLRFEKAQAATRAARAALAAYLAERIAA